MNHEWKIYGECACGFHTRAPFGEIFHIHYEICPDCAKSKYSWELKTKRYVFTPVWYNPFSWFGSGYWETRE